MKAGFRFPLREKHKHGVSFGIPLKSQNFQNLKRRRKLTAVKEKIPSGHGCREVLSNFDETRICTALKTRKSTTWLVEQSYFLEKKIDRSSYQKRRGFPLPFTTEKRQTNMESPVTGQLEFSTAAILMKHESVQH